MCVRRTLRSNNFYINNRGHEVSECTDIKRIERFQIMNHFTTFSQYEYVRPDFENAKELIRKSVDKIKNAGRVFTAMISRSIENSMETSDSMRARGYGMKGRSSFSLFRFHTHDGILLAICAALLMFTLAGFAFSKLDFYSYPRISRLPVTPFAVSVYAAFGI